MQHRDSTSLNIVKCKMLNSFGHHVASCCRLCDVERSLMSIKHLMEHRLTFLLFSCMNNKVALVWPLTSTLLHWRTRSKSSLGQGQRADWPKIWDHYLSQISNLHKQFKSARHDMLYSFGHAVQHHPTKLNLTMLNDVAFVWPGIKLYKSF